MKKMSALALSVAAAASASVLMTSPAHANQSYPLSGTLNTSGTLVQYSTWRPHTAAGASDFTLSDQVGCGDNRWSRFGLRYNQSSNQFTNTIQINGETGNGRFLRADNGSATLPTGQYALNGRMANETGHFCDNSWSGSIYL